MYESPTVTKLSDSASERLWRCMRPLWTWLSSTVLLVHCDMKQRVTLPWSSSWTWSLIWPTQAEKIISWKDDVLPGWWWELRLGSAILEQKQGSLACIAWSALSSADNLISCCARALWTYSPRISPWWEIVVQSVLKSASRSRDLPDCSIMVTSEIKHILKWESEDLT